MNLKLGWSCRPLAAIAVALLVAVIDITPSASSTAGFQEIDQLKEQRRAQADAGQLPLTGTPDLARLEERLAASGFTVGSPMLIRIFKAESTLEIYMRRGERFVLFSSYPICYWSGVLGPKIKSGDRQAPEGFFSITSGGVLRHGRWHRALDLAYPTAYDRLQERTGDGILIHGRCSSIGCFAMTNPVIEELHDLSAAALAAGQKSIPVHVFPFKMTAANMARHGASPWLAFWQELRPVYDQFEATGVPPLIGICDKQYSVAPGSLSDDNNYAVEPRCDTVAAARGRMPRFALAGVRAMAVHLSEDDRSLRLRELYEQAVEEARAKPVKGGSASSGAAAANSVVARGVKIRCNLALASCKKWVALRNSRKFARRQSAKAAAKTETNLAPKARKKKAIARSAKAFVAK